MGKKTMASKIYFLRLGTDHKNTLYISFWYFPQCFKNCALFMLQPEYSLNLSLTVFYYSCLLRLLRSKHWEILHSNPSRKKVDANMPKVFYKQKYYYYCCFF